MNEAQTKKLMALKEKVEEAKSQQSRFEGQLQSEMSRMEKDFGVKTIKQAEKKLSDLQKAIDAQSADLAEALDRVSWAIEDMEKDVEA